MEQTAAAEGLEHRLSEDGVTGNTFDAHRLLQLAGRAAARTPRSSGCSAPTSPKAGRCSSPRRWRRLAVEAGLGEDEVREVLAGDA